VHEQMVRGMSQINYVKQLCDTCMVTKLKRWPFPRQASYHTPCAEAAQACQR
jgi:hypothetical protein